MALIIAGERSGVGKTTLTLALLAFLKQKGYKVQSFKVGPDYIDPLFHTAITGYPCRNLDPILTSEAYVQSSFNRHCYGKDYALVEGVMGLFDGVKFPEIGSKRPEYASTAHIARLLTLPIGLVIDCRSLSTSVAAIAAGYRSLDPSLKIAGVILNGVGSDRHLELLKEALDSLSMPILGVFRRQDDLSLPQRHLGLIPIDEFSDAGKWFDKLANLAKNCCNWDFILPLLIPPTGCASWQSLASFPAINIAIARDRAFNFYYPDNLEILQELGAKLSFFSPIKDKNIPPQSQGLLLGGGFPEIFASDLSENHAMKQCLQQAILQGMPTYAECGGLMYLSEAIRNFEGQSFPMLGILPTKAVMGDKLTLGYRQAFPNCPHWLFSSPLWGHEFHYSCLISSPSQPIFTLKSLSSQQPLTQEGWHFLKLHASYLHLHWGEKREIAQKFYQASLDFSEKSR